MVIINEPVEGMVYNHSKCMKRDCNDNGYEFEVLDSQTGEEVRFRCGDMFMCIRHMKDADARHPEYDYKLLMKPGNVVVIMECSECDYLLSSLTDPSKYRTNVMRMRLHLKREHGISWDEKMKHQSARLVL